MKENQTANDEQVSKLLHKWRVDATPAPHFREQVWRRIEHAEVEHEPRIWIGLGRLIDVILPKPKVAMAYVTVLAIIGVAAGSIVAQIRGQQLNRTLSEQYVQSIDPYKASG